MGSTNVGQLFEPQPGRAGHIEGSEASARFRVRRQLSAGRGFFAFLMSPSGKGRKSLAFRRRLRYYELEIRISKSEANSRSESRKLKTASHVLRRYSLENLHLDIQYCFEFRISCFEFLDFSGIAACLSSYRLQAVVVDLVVPTLLQLAV